MWTSVVYTFLILSTLEEASLATRYLVPDCPTPVLKNGKVKKRQRGKFAKFVCNTGYMLAGERFSSCMYRKWDPAPPKCVRPTCVNKPNPPNNGDIYPSHNGAALHVYCKPGYQIRGPSDIYCDGRKWDNNMPVCLQSNTKPKLFCDFEEEDICGWSHDLNHDFDWRRENYKTPSGSIGTGPSFDHTKGPGEDGYYMYIESSSRTENDTAKLISPIFEKTDTETCLEFFYHMYGATTGTLRVHLKTTSDSWDLDPHNAIFSKSGNQGDRWYRSYHSLGVIGDEYQIIIEGVRGNGYVSDIAVDDVKVIENCVYEEETTTIETMTSQTLLAVESCQDRCGHKANGTEVFQIACDCDETCYDNNKCCPDYFDVCLSGTTSEDYVSTTELVNEPTSIYYSTYMTTKKILPSQTTIKSVTTIATTRATTPTDSRKPLPKSTVIPKATTIKLFNVSRPVLHFLTQPTQPVVVKKLIPSIPVKPKKKPPLFPKPKQIDKDKEEIDSNDIAEVPRPTNSDEELLFTPPPTSWYGKENLPPEAVEDSPFLGNFSEKDKLFSVRSSPAAGYNVVLLVISIVGITILTTVIAVILIRRYRGGHRRMASANGDSQSDVRFLTSDEVLDFSLDKNYDSL